MQRFNNLIMRWSRRWWLLLAAALASFLSFQLLVLLGERFAAVTGGYRPLDLQNPVTLVEMLQQLPRYTAASRTVYWIFIAADMVFPVAAALPLALVLAKALRGVNRAWATSALRRGLALTPFLAAVLDWVENGFFVATVGLYPRDISAWATLGLAMKGTKIGLLALLNLMIAGLVCYAGITWLAAARRRAREHPTTGLEGPPTGR